MVRGGEWLSSLSWHSLTWYPFSGRCGSGQQGCSLKYLIGRDITGKEFIMVGKSIVKTLHILSACLWFGAAMSVILLHCVRGWSDNYPQLVALNENFSLLDIALIIPGAMGSAITGFLICKTTSWGFTRFWWVIAKGIATICGILIGTALLGPWQMQMVQMSKIIALTAQADSSYLSIRLLFTLVSFLQIFLLTFIITLSVRKPWGRRLTVDKKSTAIKPRGEVMGQFN